MNNIAKIAGWGQFVFQFLGSAIDHGIPTTALQWFSLVGSLVAAIGIHAAGSTDGTK